MEYLMKYILSVFIVFFSFNFFLHATNLFVDDLAQPWNIKSSKENLQKNLGKLENHLTKVHSYSDFRPLKPHFDALQDLQVPFEPQQKEIPVLTQQVGSIAGKIQEGIKKAAAYKGLEAKGRFYLLLIEAQALRCTAQIPHRNKTWNSFLNDSTTITERAKKLRNRFGAQSPTIQTLYWLSEDKLTLILKEQRKNPALIKIDPKESLLNATESVKSYFFSFGRKLSK